VRVMAQVSLTPLAPPQPDEAGSLRKLLEAEYLRCASRGERDWHSSGMS